MERQAADGIGKGGGAVGVRHDRPRHGDLLMLGAGPFDIGDRDPAVEPGLDRLDHIGMAKGVGVALALQLRLAAIHRARDVDREDQFEIDIGRRPRRGYRQGKGNEPGGEQPAALKRDGLNSGTTGCGPSRRPGSRPAAPA